MTNETKEIAESIVEMQLAYLQVKAAMIVFPKNLERSGVLAPRISELLKAVGKHIDEQTKMNNGKQKEILETIQKESSGAKRSLRQRIQARKSKRK